MLLAPGQNVEGVRVTGVLRQDPAGTVYAGEAGPGDPVSLFVVTLGVEADARARGRLRRAALGASHPGLERAREVGDLPDGTPYVLCDAAPGEPLSRLLARGPLSADEAARAGLLLCQALCAAHRAGVVHRDLLPERVLLHGAGAALAVKVLGLGVSRVAPPRDSPYRPPEASGQREEELDGRCDQFALGTLLGEMGARGPAALAAERARAPRREDRFPSMAAFAQALSGVVLGAPALGTPAGRGVLLVDDDEDSACALRDILTSRGYRCSCAADGAGLSGDALRARGIELIILDVALPGEPGDAICRRLKAQGQKVVLLSALAGGRRQARSAQADAYLDKPFEMSELLAVVARLLG